MAAKDITVQVEGKILKLSNLDKVLFPFTKIIKAELIQYYQTIAPYILPHISNRPLSLIRFPDGIDKVKFYAKNKPDWTPDWINSCILPTLASEKPKEENEIIQYLQANNTATMVWLANLAAIEWHAMPLRSMQFLPDQIIFDLDPPEGMPFAEIKKIAWNLKVFLESKNYHPFLKTSGSKGLHIYVPIIPEQPTEIVVEHAKLLAKAFIATEPNTTLLLSKDRRTNKVLIDIFRNHRSQTCVHAYSVRGKEGAPISMPLRWTDLESLNDSQQFNINNALEYLQLHGDAWQEMHRFAVPLANIQIQKNTDTTNIKEKALDTNSNSETDPILEAYAQKRDFSKTNEPIAIKASNSAGRLKYVIQKHNATNLHYDLRLEFDGVLLSWALPKAMPNKPGEKRMAIETEAHPLKYLDFEGIIPKEEYGGGEMWIFDTGMLNYIKKEENKISFVLSEGAISGSFSLYRTENNKWLIEKKEEGLLVEKISIQPMLAEITKVVKPNYFFEIKWDGIRVIIKKIADEVTLYSKSGKDLTEKFPEIIKAILEMDIQTGLIDGEIVCLNNAGIPQFNKVISRMHLTGSESIKHASMHNAATCYTFDLLYIDGLDVRKLAIEKRRRWLQISFTDMQALRFSASFTDGNALLEGIKQQGMEGIMCKRLGSAYQSNTRSADWLKLKIRNTEDAIVIGYTKGDGDRSNTFGSLILAQIINEQLVYKGKVGTGFGSEQLTEYKQILDSIPKSTKLIVDVIDEESNAIWIEPCLRCEVQIASLTNNGTFREPVFVKWANEA